MNTLSNSAIFNHQAKYKNQNHPINQKDIYYFHYK